MQATGAQAALVLAGVEVVCLGAGSVDWMRCCRRRTGAQTVLHCRLLLLTARAAVAVRGSDEEAALGRGVEAWLRRLKRERDREGTDRELALAATVRLCTAKKLQHLQFETITLALVQLCCIHIKHAYDDLENWLVLSG